MLAVLGYSVNESVVVFDRVRETFKKQKKMTTPQVLDHAITSTISRTIITHGSTQLMVTSMLIFGGAALHYFALALTIGICFGIYSSVLVASPLVMVAGRLARTSSCPSPRSKKQEAVVLSATGSQQKSPHACGLFLALSARFKRGRTPRANCSPPPSKAADAPCA